MSQALVGMLGVGGGQRRSHYPINNQYSSGISDWTDTNFVSSADTRFSDEDSEDYSSYDEREDNLSEHDTVGSDERPYSDEDQSVSEEEDEPDRRRHRKKSSAPAASSSAESEALAFVSTTGNPRSRVGKSKPAAASSNSPDTVLSGWAPLTWPTHYLPEANVRLEWRATMTEFAEGEIAGSSGGSHVDCSMFNVSPDELTEFCRRDAPRSYSGCSSEMIRVIHCRQKDRSINVVTIDMENIASTLPFDVSIRCTNVDQLNEMQVRTIDGHGNPIVRRVMAIVPHAGSAVSHSTRVTDMRRIITDPSMLSMMMIDENEVKSSISETQVRGERSTFSMLKGSIVHKFVEHIGADQSYDENLRRHATRILMSVKTSKGAKKRSENDQSGKEVAVGYWFDNMPADSLRYVRDWIIDETKVITKISELKFKIEPVGGPGMWKTPGMWTLQGGMNAYFVVTQAIVSGNTVHRESLETSAEFSKLYQRVSANIRISFL